MNKKNSIIVCAAIICASTAFIFASQTTNQFVVSKKKTLSKSKLKEHNAQQLTDLLQKLPAQIKAIADLQEVAMAKVGAYIEGEKNCFWTHANAEQLTDCLANVQRLQAQLDGMHSQLQKTVQFLQNLDNIATSANCAK